MVVCAIFFLFTSPSFVDVCIQEMKCQGADIERNAQNQPEKLARMKLLL
jgi:hypothetical protein